MVDKAGVGEKKVKKSDMIINETNKVISLPDHISIISGLGPIESWCILIVTHCVSGMY